AAAPQLREDFVARDARRRDRARPRRRQVDGRGRRVPAADRAGGRRAAGVGVPFVTVSATQQARHRSRAYRIEVPVGLPEGCGRRGGGGRVCGGGGGGGYQGKTAPCSPGGGGKRGGRGDARTACFPGPSSLAARRNLVWHFFGRRCKMRAVTDGIPAGRPSL